MIKSGAAYAYANLKKVELSFLGVFSVVVAYLHIKS